MGGGGRGETAMWLLWVNQASPLLPRHYDTFMLRPLCDVHSASYTPCGTTHTTEGNGGQKKGKRNSQSLNAV